MRIAYLTQSYPPMISGAALFAQQIAENIAWRGHQVLVIAASDRDDPYMIQRDNITVVRLASLHNPLRVGQRFLLYPRRAVMNMLHEFEPDLIHVHEPLQIGLLGLEYAKRARIPSLLTIHQLPSFVSSYLPGSLRPYTESILWTYANWLCRQFTTIITPTQTIASLVNHMTGVPACTMGYGIDLQAFHPSLSEEDKAALRQKWDLPPYAPLLLHVGRLDTDKHVGRVLHAAVQSVRASRAHLVIVGDGTQKSDLIRQGDTLGIADRVHFLGFISKQGGLPELYRMADLFVTASEIETQGIVLLEAAASGLPIAAMRATCIPEIVHHGVNGFLAEPGDIHGLGAVISDLLQHPSRAAAMGKASLTLAARHSQGSTLDAHEQLYSQCVHQTRAQGRKLTAGVENEWWRRIRAWADLH